jgi:DNA-binding NarL/FixJ family response regulator
MMEESEGGKKMRAAGADEFVPKSGPPEKLLAAIQRTIRPRGGGGQKNHANSSALVFLVPH